MRTVITSRPEVDREQKGRLLYLQTSRSPIFGNLANFFTPSLRAERVLRLHVERDSNETAPALQAPI